MIDTKAVLIYGKGMRMLSDNLLNDVFRPTRLRWVLLATKWLKRHGYVNLCQDLKAELRCSGSSSGRKLYQ